MPVTEALEMTVAGIWVFQLFFLCVYSAGCMILLVPAVGLYIVGSDGNPKLACLSWGPFSVA